MFIRIALETYCDIAFVHTTKICVPRIVLEFEEEFGLEMPSLTPEEFRLRALEEWEAQVARGIGFGFQKFLRDPTEPIC